MSNNNDTDVGQDSTPNNRELDWSCKEVLRTLLELNEMCLELLAEQALQPHPPAAPMLRELADLWKQLDSAARKRAAMCPYLLIDAGFSDPYRWKWVGDQRPGSTTPFRIHDRDAAGYAMALTGPTATRVAHQIFCNSWYIVQTQPIAAPVFLGMPTHCADLLRACTMRQINDLANRQTGWLRPRWPGRVQAWRKLLESAVLDEPEALEMARMHGVQLLAMELKAMERLSEAKNAKQGPG